VKTTNEKTVIGHSWGLWFRYLRRRVKRLEARYLPRIPTFMATATWIRCAVSGHFCTGVVRMYDPRT